MAVVEQRASRVGPATLGPGAARFAHRAGDKYGGGGAHRRAAWPADPRAAPEGPFGMANPSTSQHCSASTAGVNDQVVAQAATHKSAQQSFLFPPDAPRARSRG